MANEPRTDARSVATQLRSAIEAGKLAPGEKLPKNSDLCRMYGVNKNTMSKAIGLLKAAGVVSGVAGGATRVRVKHPFGTRGNLDYQEEKNRVLSLEGIRMQSGGSERLLEIPVKELHEDHAEYDVIECPENVAEMLKIPAGNRALKRSYTRRHVANAGIIRSESFIPYDLVKDYPDLLDSGKEPWPGGVLHQLYTAGIEAGRIEDRITVTMPTNEESKDFDVPPGVPMYHRTRIIYNIDERPVEVAFTPIPSDRISFIFSTPLERW